MEKTKKRGISVRELCYIALFAVLMAVCAWIQIPGSVPFTMQTFAVFAALGILGGRRGTIAVALYILLGCVGLPVFSGFQGGVGVLLGLTGGYIVGFLFSGLVYWLITRLLGTGLFPMALGMAAGLIVCYLFGTVWFTVAYAKTSGSIGFLAAMAKCVFPFILPDAAKIALALLLTRRVGKYVRL